MTRIILPCAKGSEQVLTEEAQALGLQQVKTGVAVVSGEGDMETAYRLCLWSRVASRVLWVLDEGKIESPDDLYARVEALDWDEHVDVDRTFAVSFNGIGQGIHNTQFGALKAKDAIVDKLRKVLRRRPDVDSRNPDLSIDLHLRKGILTTALDLSGGALHQRGYRQQQGVAPLKEHLAATLLYRAHWPTLARQGANFIDPMCGAGTLVCEAVLMAADIAPGLSRKRFGFEHWQSHKPGVWRRLLDDAKTRRDAGLAALANKFYGFDENGQVLALARQNAETAGIARHIHFEKRALASLRAEKAYGERGLIASNPPYGERLGNTRELLATYTTLGATFKTFPDGWQMALISTNTDMLKRLRLRASRDYQAFNGALEGKIMLYQRDNQPEDRETPVAEHAAHLGDGAQMFANRLAKNYAHMGKLAAKRGVEAWRVYDQDLPEYAVAIDLYGDHAHIQEYAPPKTIDPQKARQRILDILQAVPQVLPVKAENIVLKTRARQSGKAQYDKHDAREEYLQVAEGKAQFFVNLHDYLDTGLFLDHRLMRERLGAEAEGKRVLNLFCYTATASVHAALGGAAYTTSVDLSPTYLDWAQRNFDLNGLSDRHRLQRGDVMAWMAEGDSQFDLIFCDPPTFSNTKKTQRVFDVQRDHVTLIEHCMRRLAPGGTLYFSNNFRQFRLDPALGERFAVADISDKTIDFDFKRRPNIHRVWRIRHRE
ncbi:MAG: bifunctional 23S rRNA (guanine(2069)-N(7))-methyltransferase RlmK/23S rRNA (guanine(2445)-N(2))-methyltransferase RlmL [Cardiobacteriaceae bacterium]|nr:bifunctional 23S rRNA (guanine(2069)-N(7))-methyltransferase RlmK/23S rRNA (guanine(2445)-N(2))-methyltransferase RlmL [Cardiobacteriaceae bacterium]